MSTFGERLVCKSCRMVQRNLNIGQTHSMQLFTSRYLSLAVILVALNTASGTSEESGMCTEKEREFWNDFLHDASAKRAKQKTENYPISTDLQTLSLELARFGSSLSAGPMDNLITAERAFRAVLRAYPGFIHMPATRFSCHPEKKKVHGFQTCRRKGIDRIFILHTTTHSLLKRDVINGFLEVQ
jgi:hypothetical protein